MLKRNDEDLFYSIKDYIAVLIFEILLLFCIYPSFSNIGKLTLQIISTVSLSVMIALISIILRNGFKTIALALNIFYLLMVIFTLGWQLYLQIRNFLSTGSFRGWMYMYFYDKLMTIGLVWFSVTAVFTLIRIAKIKSSEVSTKYKFNNYFNISSRGFLLYYLFFLFYSFVLIRSAGTDISQANFIPFRMILNYLKISDYEAFLIFGGNLLIFTPLGFYIKVIKPKTKALFIILFPIVISLFIEFSQLIIKNGNCDVDDVILNSIGFYLGAAIKVALDSIVACRTNNKEKTIFYWQPYSLLYLK